MTRKMQLGHFKNRFRDIDEYHSMCRMLEDWSRDPGGVRGIFLSLADRFMAKEGTTFTFNIREGVSYSLRAWVDCGPGQNRLFGLVDIVDDNPEERWLSVCFYDEKITDPLEAGNVIPHGLLGEDGYCFDLFENNGPLISYVMQKIDEAHANTKD